MAASLVSQPDNALTPFLRRGYGALAPLAMVEPSVARERV